MVELQGHSVPLFNTIYLNAAIIEVPTYDFNNIMTNFGDLPEQ